MSSEIKFYHRYTKTLEKEKVYGDALIKFVYRNPLGKFLLSLLKRPWLSKLYGYLQSKPSSRLKVAQFIKDFSIPMEDYQGGSLVRESKEDSYQSFNEFFIRSFVKGKRPFPEQSNRMGAFAEARYYGHESISEKTLLPVKGSELNYHDLIGGDASEFEGGPFLIARLCPVDYHRYHFPDEGRIVKSYRVKGVFDSVNPLALQFLPQILRENERQVSLIETKNFGKIAYIEVAAMCVGKMVQTHQEQFKRGEEKGYFLFGGSTVIVLGQKGKWKPSEDILSNTQKGIETYIHLGDEVAKALL